MGVDPFGFSDSLTGVLAQRLVRRLCSRCRIKRAAAPGEIERLADEYCYESELDPAAVLHDWRTRFGGPEFVYEANGCEHCRRSGYRGRIGLFELLEVTPTLRQAIVQRAAAGDICTLALRNGMRTIRQDGIEKCLTGDTDILEVRAAAY
jgi:type II secretory ATPase GspE/PulE/Tfp pilus assembly ATPase PilB-like protein